MSTDVTNTPDAERIAREIFSRLPSDEWTLVAEQDFRSSRQLTGHWEIRNKETPSHLAHVWADGTVSLPRVAGCSPERMAELAPTIDEIIAMLIFRSPTQRLIVEDWQDAQMGKTAAHRRAACLQIACRYKGRLFLSLGDRIRPGY